MTEAFSCQVVTGPASREVLGRITDADLSLPWLSHQSAQIAGRLARSSSASRSRASSAGRSTPSVADTPAIWDAIVAAGARPFGMYALDSLRIEKGYRAWKGDLSTDYTLLEGGLDRFIRWDKPRVSSARRRCWRRSSAASPERFVPMIVEAGRL